MFYKQKSPSVPIGLGLMRTSQLLLSVVSAEEDTEPGWPTAAEHARSCRSWLACTGGQGSPPPRGTLPTTPNANNLYFSFLDLFRISACDHPGPTVSAMTSGR